MTDNPPDAGQLTTGNWELTTDTLQRTTDNRQRTPWLTDPTRQRRLLIAFWPLTALALWCDSRVLGAISSVGQGITDGMALLFLALVAWALPSERRVLVLLFVPVSALGEGVFSLLFGLYHYRLGGVPLYVPCGHAILLAVGLLLADQPWIVRHTAQVRAAGILFHGGLIGGALLLYGDTLSALFGLGFALILLRQRGRPFYLIMGGLVLYIELLGTAWGCWTWDAQPWGVLHTTNPPTGAFACYVVADLIVLRLTRRLLRGRGVPVSG